MSKEDNLIEIDGTVFEILPNAMFRVKLENDHEILTYTGGKLRKSRNRIRLGSVVTVELSSYDLTKGRVKNVKKY